MRETLLLAARETEPDFGIGEVLSALAERRFDDKTWAYGTLGIVGVQK
jgi:hypothetical protein